MIVSIADELSPYTPPSHILEFDSTFKPHQRILCEKHIRPSNEYGKTVLWHDSGDDIQSGDLLALLVLRMLIPGQPNIISNASTEVLYSKQHESVSASDIEELRCYREVTR
jgi:hypothetical protein